MIKHIEKIRKLVQDICPEQEHILDNQKIISFFEQLKTKFEELGLDKKFTAKGLYCDIDFCYRHPLVFWTRTGINFAKRYEDELFADFFVDGDTLYFETSYEEDYDEEDYDEDEKEDKDKSWPLERLTTTPETLMLEVIACYEDFYQKYRAVKNW